MHMYTPAPPSCANQNLLYPRFLFWVSGETISRRSLGGVEYDECHKASSAPTALTVDPDRQRLYWLSHRDGGGPLTVNQLE